MIRPLTEADRAATLAFLGVAPHFNLYMLGNLEKLGFAHEFCEFWGDVTEVDGATVMTAVLNRYMSGWTVYGQAAANWQGLGAILDAHGVTPERLQDNPGGIDSFVPYLQRYGQEKMEIEEVMDLRADDFQPLPAPAGVTIRRGTLADLPKLVAFYSEAGTMARTPTAVERPIRDTRLWLAEEQGEVISTALTNAETSTLAMIGGVFTPPAQRGRKLSQAVCSALCADLLAADKQPVLYWGNPAAGAVYHKLGFRPQGQWRAVWLQAR